MTDKKIKAVREKLSELRGRRGAELELWHHWNANGRQEHHLEPLLSSLEPNIERETTRRLAGLGGSMPKGALKAELRHAVVKSFETYDPNKGTLFGHVNNSFKRVTDAVNRNRNVSHVPKGVANLYQAHRNVINELTDELGREPQPHEVLARMPPGTRSTDLARLNQATRPELFSDVGSDQDEPTRAIGVRDAYALLRPTFTDEQRRFTELHYPQSGPSVPIKTIATRMNIPAHKAYRIKSVVERRLGEVLKKT